MNMYSHPARLAGILLISLALITFSYSTVAYSAMSSAFKTGWLAYQKEDYSTAFRIWSSLAEKGDAEAQINLGILYDYGRGITQNYVLAAKWYRTAARQNHSLAQYNLGLLMKAKLVPADEFGAEYWLKKSAALGNADAHKELSTLPLYEEMQAYAVEAPVSVGTAWPVAAGYAVTNHHVVAGKSSVRLIDHKGEEVTAHVVATDKDNDIAFLKTGELNRLPPALPLSTQRSSLGTSVFTIGFPRIDIMGKSPKLSQGIISGENGLQDDPDSYQISVPIQPGNSGGPLLNMRGEVVGMITSMLGEVMSETGETVLIPNINYAVKTGVIQKFLSQIPKNQNNRELQAVDADLESLARRIKQSVLMVKAE